MLQILVQSVLFIITFVCTVCEKNGLSSTGVDVTLRCMLSRRHLWYSLLNEL